jgi:hypothetical protein
MASPGVITREKDVSLNINSIESNASSMVGLFRWGPVNELVRITTNESELVQKMGRPDSATTISFHSALNYLTYVKPLYIVRAVDDAVALNAAPSTGTPTIVGNDGDYETVDLTGNSFIGRYPGTLGNSLRISVADDSGFSGWEYENDFEFAPQTGEFNVVVVDEDGEITGTAGTILESYELMTKVEGSKKPNGASAYITKVLQDQSQYVLTGDLDEIIFTESGSLGIYDVSLTGGVDGNDSANADFSTAAQALSNSETLDIISTFTSAVPAASKGTLIDTMVTRQDAVAFVAPELDDVYNNPTAADDVVDYFNSTINKNTSYAFYVDNWKLVYDKYADKNIWIPTDSDAAALHSRVFVQNEPWFSPAGLNRGQLKNVIKLAWNPNKAQRDVLYKESINSVVAFPGEGTVLFGDKTALKRPSAFSRLNVRSLFIVLKKSIAEASKFQLFELNDQITRNVFRNAVDRYLNSVQGRRGINRYSVVCDETNNTPQVINSYEFVGDIYIDPARSINTIKLNFIAVDAGVSFEEIEGA